jgi:hypothetical protein
MKAQADADETRVAMVDMIRPGVLVKTVEEKGHAMLEERGHE